MLQILDVAAAAQQLRLSKTTIRRMVASGELPAYRVGHLVRIRAADLNRVLHRIPTSGDAS